jgi:hypothetical protein
VRTLDGKQGEPAAGRLSVLYLEYDHPTNRLGRAWVYLKASEVSDLTRLYLDAAVRGLSPLAWSRNNASGWTQQTIDDIVKEFT